MLLNMLLCITDDKKQNSAGVDYLMAAEHDNALSVT